MVTADELAQFRRAAEGLVDGDPAKRVTLSVLDALTARDADVAELRAKLARAEARAAELWDLVEWISRQVVPGRIRKACKAKLDRLASTQPPAGERGGEK